MISIIKQKESIVISNTDNKYNIGMSIYLKDISLYSILKLMWWKLLEVIKYEKVERDN